MMTIMMNLLLISIIFPSLSHPLSMGLMLIIQTLNVSLIVGMMIKSFWFSYVFVMIMLSGALVLFIYMSSIASNEKFNMSTTLMYSMIMIIVINIMLSMYYDPSTMNLFNQATHQLSSLNKLFSIQNMMITIMLASYLFLTMIAINYIVNINEGPLRSKN
uniref:NADH dehydrogenase subunit 6 n=1 Tax=Sigara lateralis TaxID=537456 RepID=UPI00286AFBAF|nr:NADH dehydrogenase subunit 6 [Sigara lateralis]WKD80510.1 NADH dehydrogenase subunit 6 [Sigara lateralis]